MGILNPTLAEKIYAELMNQGRTWAQDPRRRYTILQSLISKECQDAVRLKIMEFAHSDLKDERISSSSLSKSTMKLTLEIAQEISPTSPLPLAVSWGLLRDAFWAVRKDYGLSCSIRDEAAEFDHACVLLSSKRVNQVRQRFTEARFGRICRWCWRTESECWFDRGIYGLCHLHDENSLQTTLGSSAMTREAEQETWRQHKIEVRLKVASARRLLKVVSKEELNPFCYPKYRRSRNRPPDPKGQAWHDWVIAEYPLAAAFLKERSNLSILGDPLSTLVGLEGRLLMPHELSQMQNPFNWDVTLARCEAWHRLVQASRKMK